MPPDDIAPRFVVTAVVLGVHGLFAGWLAFYYIPFIESAGRSSASPLVLKGTLACYSVLLFAHAFGLLMQRPFAWGFSLGFCGLNAIVSLGWGGLALLQVFHEGAPEGIGVIGWTALAILLALLTLQGMVCGLMAALLYRGRDRLARPVSAAAWAGGLLGAGALAAVCVVVWKLFP